MIRHDKLHVVTIHLLMSLLAKFVCCVTVCRDSCRASYDGVSENRSTAAYMKRHSEVSTSCALFIAQHG